MWGLLIYVRHKLKLSFVDQKHERTLIIVAKDNNIDHRCKDNNSSFTPRIENWAIALNIFMEEHWCLLKMMTILHLFICFDKNSFRSSFQNFQIKNKFSSRNHKS